MWDQGEGHEGSRVCRPLTEELALCVNPPGAWLNVPPMHLKACLRLEGMAGPLAYLVSGVESLPAWKSQPGIWKLASAAVSRGKSAELFF